jgi:polysaccharide export outer membrane protein
MFKQLSNMPLIVLLLSVLTAACSSSGSVAPKASPDAAAPSADYLIGAGDTLSVFVWRNPDLSVSVPVRPDGKISTPLVEDIQAVGKSPTQLSRDMEAVLSEFVKSPRVNIIVTGFVGTFSEQIRVIGKASDPRSISYRDDITLLDVMIEVGGLAEGASGNRAKIVRTYGGQNREIKARIHDLINKGDISENVEMMPGDVLIIPESRF